MTKVTISIPGYRCERCKHTWVARATKNKKKGQRPKLCPKCRSPWWETPK